MRLFLALLALLAVTVAVPAIAEEAAQAPAAEATALTEGEAAAPAADPIAGIVQWFQTTIDGLMGKPAAETAPEGEQPAPTSGT